MLANVMANVLHGKNWNNRLFFHFIIRITCNIKNKTKKHKCLKSISFVYLPTFRFSDNLYFHLFLRSASYFCSATGFGTCEIHQHLLHICWSLLLRFHEMTMMSGHCNMGYASWSMRTKVCEAYPNSLHYFFHWYVY